MRLTYGPSSHMINEIQGFVHKVYMLYCMLAKGALLGAQNHSEMGPISGVQITSVLGPGGGGGGAHFGGRAQIAPTPASWGLYHTGTSVLCGEGRGRRKGREVSWPVVRLSHCPSSCAHSKGTNDLYEQAKVWYSTQRTVTHQT